MDVGTRAAARSRRPASPVSRLNLCDSALRAQDAGRIIPKLNAEAELQLGPGGSANAKRGTLDVHRGGTVLLTSQVP